LYLGDSLIKPSKVPDIFLDSCKRMPELIGCQRIVVSNLDTKNLKSNLISWVIVNIMLEKN